MVHLRLNDREANPNPHVNFITPLKMMDEAAEEKARQLLRALAAQVRPIMKAEGFVVNSLEEYEHNKVFAGRNWNNGETVELVLRGAAGGFLPTSWLLSTLCHELAHIKHMNHGPAFQALWAKLRRDVRELQSTGYYGDGYWSSGTRLADSARMGGQGLEPGDLPEYMCGGAQARARPSARRRRRGPAGPSNHTGAQTAKKRKPGSRVTAKGLFKGTGRALNDDAEDEDQKKAGAGFRKQANSKRAREERALAAERRLLALQGKAAAVSPATKESSDEEDLDYEEISETDQQRRQAVLEAADKSELDGLQAWKHDYSSEFIFPPGAPSSAVSGEKEMRPTSVDPVTRNRSKGKGKDQDLGVVVISSDEDDASPLTCDVQLLPDGGAAASSSARLPSTGVGKDLPTSSGRKDSRLLSWPNAKDSPTTAPSTKKQSLSYGTLVQDEIRSRKKESLGLDGPGRQLGGAPASRKNRTEPRMPTPNPLLLGHGTENGDGDPTTVARQPWSCGVCTLLNEPAHLACSMCGTPRGESVWAGNHP